METVDNYFQRGKEFLGTKYPIMGGAMTWVSESNLVSAISNAGGLGVLACGSMDAQKLRNEILITKKKTTCPFGVNLILLHPEINSLIDCCISEKVEIVVFAGGFPKRSQIEILKKNNIKTICFATTLAIAKKMVSNGIDALILEGNEAGGHIGPVSVNVLVQEILPHIREVPIFVAGGMGRGEIILKFLQLGASGCQIGTRFVCSNESIAHQNFKDMFLKSEARNAQVSIALDERLPVIPVRAIENKATQEFLEKQKNLLKSIEDGKVSLKDAQLSIEHFWAGSLKKAVIDGDVEKGSLMAGQSVSLVKKIQSVEEIFLEIIQQMEGQVSFEQKVFDNV